MFDIWMVFAIALLLAFVQLGMLRTGVKTVTSGQEADPQTHDALPSRSIEVTQLQLTQEKLTGQGQRLGTAYRLKSGQVVYVPDKSP